MRFRCIENMGWFNQLFLVPPSPNSFRNELPFGNESFYENVCHLYGGRGEGRVIQLLNHGIRAYAIPSPALHQVAKLPCPDLYKFLQKPGAGVCLFGFESQRGQRKIAARQFPLSKMEVSPALHSIQCGSRGYPANPMITREIKSLPHQLFDSGRKRKSLLPRVCSPHHPLSQKCQAETAFSLCIFS